MKNLCFIIALAFLTNCSANQPVNRTNVANVKVKNEQLAITNEVSSITRAAQKLENQGRGLEVIRTSRKPEGQRECNSIVESAGRDIADLNLRIQKLPDNFKLQLAPIIPELTECVSCSQKASESCTKSRALINAAIKTLFPK